MLHFADKGTSDIFNRSSTKAARKTLPQSLHSIAKRKLDQLAYATDVNDLRWPPGNKLEKLKGDLSEFYSIRINDQWRVVFKWSGKVPTDIAIVDYHK